MSEPTEIHAVPSSADQSLGALVNSAIADVRNLVKMEKELAIAEVTQAGQRLIPVAGGFGVAALGGFFLIMFASIAAAYIISSWLWLGWGFLIVTGFWLVVVIVGALVGRSALKKLQGPERTVRTVKDTAEWARHPGVHPPVQAATPGVSVDVS